MCVCERKHIMDGSTILRCSYPPCLDQIDGELDHVPFAQKALALRYPLILKCCDGGADQWVYFGKREGDCQHIIVGLC